jgi:prepilin-type N-terminal cleavage/methylation domain-containing protein
MQKIRSRAGFTLVEILIAVAISLIVMAAIFEVFIAQKRQYITEDLILEMESSGNIAIEYLSHLVQNSGYNISHGMKIEAASDHYFTTVIDENDNGVIESDEVITIALNTPTRDIGDNEQPTEVVFDPALNGKDGNDEDRFFDVFFDMNKDGTLEDSEVFNSGYNLADAPLDNAPDQVDTIKLHLTGPPYALYQYNFVLEDEGLAYNVTTNPYIVNPTPDVIVEDVDNFIIRYFDQEDMPLPVTLNADGERISPNPPYVLTREEMNSIRRVEFELMLRTTREDPEWTDTGEYPVGSVATYDDTGRPDGFTCADTGYPPVACTNDNLNSYDCFILYCDEKSYPSYGEFVPYEDHYRRVVFETSAFPKNLILNPYGSLTVTADPSKLQCPDNYVTLSATVKDAEGQPISGATVNFYSSANVSLLDFSSVSDTDAEGNPMTDANGEVTGITLKPWAKPGKDRIPANVTVSADTSITISIDGVAKEFPFYDSVVVPFLLGPPSTITYHSAMNYDNACAPESDENKSTFSVKVKDVTDLMGRILSLSWNSLMNTAMN